MIEQLLGTATDINPVAIAGKSVDPRSAAGGEAEAAFPDLVESLLGDGARSGKSLPPGGNTLPALPLADDLPVESGDEAKLPVTSAERGQVDIPTAAPPNPLTPPMADTLENPVAAPQKDLLPASAPEPAVKPAGSEAPVKIPASNTSATSSATAAPVSAANVVQGAAPNPETPEPRVAQPPQAPAAEAVPRQASATGVAPAAVVAATPAAAEQPAEALAPANAAVAVPRDAGGAAVAPAAVQTAIPVSSAQVQGEQELSARPASTEMIEPAGKRRLEPQLQTPESPRQQEFTAMERPRSQPASAAANQVQPAAAASVLTTSAPAVEAAPQTVAIPQALATAPQAGSAPGNTATATALPTGASATDLGVMNAQPHTRAWGEQLYGRLQMATRAGVDFAEIQLNPAELGKLEIQINTENERANIVFYAQNRLAREMIEAELPRLRELFQDAGIELGQSDISEQSLQQRRREAGERLLQDVGLVGPGDNGPAGPEERIQARPLGGSASLIDYYV